VALVGEGRHVTLFALGLVGAALIALVLVGIEIAWSLRPTGPAAVVPRGNIADAFSSDNYPPDAIRRGEQGRVVAMLTIDTGGDVQDCTVRTSSGSRTLDEATCSAAKRHVHFKPARDASGTAIASRYPLAVRWVLPNE
jgi:TonB family protein